MLTRSFSSAMFKFHFMLIISLELGMISHMFVCSQCTDTVQWIIKWYTSNCVSQISIKLLLHQIIYNVTLDLVKKPDGFSDELKNQNHNAISSALVGLSNECYYYYWWQHCKKIIIKCSVLICTYGYAETYSRYLTP